MKGRPVSRAEATWFLENAFRNIPLPPLSDDDVEAVRDGLDYFCRHYLTGSERSTQIVTQSVRSRAIRLVNNFVWNKRSAEQVVDDILALAAGSRRAKTPKAVECEASQSGPKGNAQTQSTSQAGR